MVERRPRVWITGAGGFIGSELARQAHSLAPGWAVIPLARAELDLTEEAQVATRFHEERPEVVIHCAGLTRSPGCEVEPDLARRLNVDVTRRLADLADEATLIFFSTDLLFDGRKGWYTEEDEPRPSGVYAETKREGELTVLSHPGHIVVRTTLNYGVSPTGDRSFHEDMLRAVRAGRRLKLFTDEYRCPIAVSATVRATWDLVNSLGKEAAGPRPSGIFHVAGTQRLSRWEIGALLAEVHPELRGRLDPTSIRDYEGPPRPADSSMCCDRIRPWLSRDLPRFCDSLG